MILFSYSAKIKNLGNNDANFSLQLFEDTNLDSIPDLLIETIQNLFVSSDDSAVFDFNYQVENLQSEKGYFVRAEFTLDQDTTNNIVIQNYRTRNTISDSCNK